MSRHYFSALILFVSIWSGSALATHGGSTTYDLACRISSWSSASSCWSPGDEDWYPSPEAACQGNSAFVSTTIGAGSYFGHMTGQPASIFCKASRTPPCNGEEINVGNGSCIGVACPAGQVFTGPGASQCSECPSGMTVQNGECACPAGQVYDGVVCKSHDDFCDAQYVGSNTRVLNSSAASTCQQFTSEDSQIVKCEMNKRGLRILPSGGGTEYVYGGNSCAPSETPSTDVPDGCVQVNGINTCVDEDSPDDDVCGSINGQDVCFGQDVPTEGCLTFADGSMICAENAPTPPSPDNGVPGEEAEPDAELTLVDDTIPSSEDQQYFTETTVGGSSGEQQGGAAGEGDGTEGVGACDPLTQNCCVGDECDDNISGGTNCSTAPQCTGSPIQCYHSKKLWEVRCAFEAPSFDQMEDASDFGLDTGSEELIPEVDEVDMEGFFNPGSASTDCPNDLSFSLVGDLGGSYTIPVSQWCSLLHVIGLLVLAAAALSAARIFAGGF